MLEETEEAGSLFNRQMLSMRAKMIYEIKAVFTATATIAATQARSDNGIYRHNYPVAEGPIESAGRPASFSVILPATAL